MDAHGNDLEERLARLQGKSNGKGSGEDVKSFDERMKVLRLGGDGKIVSEAELSKRVGKLVGAEEQKVRDEDCDIEEMLNSIEKSSGNMYGFDDQVTKLMKDLERDIGNNEDVETHDSEQDDDVDLLSSDDEDVINSRQIQKIID